MTNVQILNQTVLSLYEPRMVYKRSVSQRTGFLEGGSWLSVPPNYDSWYDKREEVFKKFVAASESVFELKNKNMIENVTFVTQEPASIPFDRESLFIHKHCQDPTSTYLCDHAKDKWLVISAYKESEQVESLQLHLSLVFMRKFEGFKYLLMYLLALKCPQLSAL
ncbi:hypothetical protein GOP47_0006904 [Adiantum capillus-veneris]|uniref:Uncharacterized protein n=1 Tax=Adiantum capillus-veneris TaxID=13818 RepID=A0A9D4V367_ADICA|nr:hypothetical protein GOP47_0006601 [Adiantum capillus-veneris]KAI5079233.1 hypothetical protein GOP47_0006904 [Adiantum capillus-veneris]